ncbi:MAG TPA: PilN domain-containing protein [Steroidobacteraceae bacterium]|nr:PilN domain-containing protein [Steroidobacteraceae bacterium]
MPRINLLPWRQQERARRQREFGFAAIGAVVAAAAAMLLTSWGYNWAIDRQKERNALLNKEIAELDKQITEILGLEAQKQRLVARMDIITRLQRSRPEVVHVFDQLARTLPDGVYLTSVKQNDKRLELKGIAQSSTRVSTLMRNIEASPWLTNPELQVVETLKSGGAGSEFTLFATQKSVEPAEDERKPGRKPVRPAGASGQ